MKSKSSDCSHVVEIIGAGLAGSEAAYALAERGIRVILRDMRFEGEGCKETPAHQSRLCAELVCSNSFRSKSPLTGAGMLKAEMIYAGSMLLDVAARHAVPAGDALAVDRDRFAEEVTQRLRSHPLIECIAGEVASPEDWQKRGGISLIASGPLTSDSLQNWLVHSAIKGEVTDSSVAETTSGDLYFYDAIAPIIDAASIDRDRCFLANRYDKGDKSDSGDEGAYINCPMNREEYEAFVQALLSAEQVVPRSFEKEIFFQSCQPIEAIASTGKESLRFGPMKPVGLPDPRTGKVPYAVVQLRAENRALTAYNLVGFQTRLKYPEQSRIFRMIPALEKVEFLRLGSIHRNTYVCGPKVLRADLSLRGHPRVYLAGQITGVEGYLESAACGLMSAWFIEQRIRGVAHSAPSATTAMGALLRHVTGSQAKGYQPSHLHFGLFDMTVFDSVLGKPLASLKREVAREALAAQCLRDFKLWYDKNKEMGH